MEQKIKNLIAETLDYILKNPAIFFSEADVQAIFWSRLMTDPALNLHKLYDTSCTIGLNNKKIPSKSKYKTTLLHREYGTNFKSKARVDMVIFDPIEVGQIIDPINLKKYDSCGTNQPVKNRKKIYLTPDYIFEFGTDKSAGSNKDLAAHIKKDLEKLHHARKRGYLIHIQRNYLLGRDTEKNTGKHKEFAKTIESIKNKYNNVKVLYFKVDVGGEKRGKYREGKVNYIFKGNLKPINQNKIKETILNELYREP
jgi:hypothetical protein